MSVYRWSTPFAALLAATLLGAAPGTAQVPAPGNVTVTPMKGYVVVSWRGVRDATVSYRVLRGPDAVKPGQDLTKPLPADATFYNDGLPVMGPVFYTVVAVYRDGSQGASIPVQLAATAASTSTVAPMPTATVSSRLTGGAPSMGPALALRATPVTSVGFTMVTLYWPPVATSVPEPVSYQMRMLKTDPATLPPGAPIGFLNSPSAKLLPDGRMAVVDYSPDLDRTTWYGVVATSTTQGSVTFPWYRRDPQPHHGVDTITGAYWPEGTSMSSRHWVGCVIVSDVPGATMYGGHIRVGTSGWFPMPLTATHLAHFDTGLPPLHQLRQYFDAAGTVLIQMWPMYPVGGSTQTVVDTAHVLQVVYNVPQVATPWDVSKCAP